MATTMSSGLRTAPPPPAPTWQTRLLDLYRKTSSRQRMAMFVLALGTMLAMAAVGVWQSDHLPQALYPIPLSTDDLAQVTLRLDQASVQYALSGDRILVAPQERQHLVSWLSTTYGLPHQMQEPTPNPNPWLPQPADPRAEREHRIERMLGQLPFVNACQVILVLPAEDSLQAPPPSQASVYLDVRPGMRPDASQVRALVEQVAAAVPGLTADHVKMMDQHGPLNPNEDRSDRQNDVEQDLEGKLRQNLDTELGPANYTVAVTAELNLESKDIEIREVLPGTASQTKKSTEDYQGQDKQYRRTVEQQRVEEGSQIRHVRIPPGGIRRLTAALTINKALTAAQIQDYTSTVTAAIGADPTRGDEVVVRSAPFYVDPRSMPVSNPPAPSASPDWILRIALVICGLGACLAWTFGGRSKPAPILDVEKAAVEPAIVDLKRTAVTSTTPRRNLEALAQRSPRQVAHCLMSTWLKVEA